MKKLLSLAFACASVALVPATAMALPVGTTFSAFLDFGDAKGNVEQSVGTWTFLPSFPADSYNYGLSACRYRVAWKNDAYISKTTNIFLDELQPVGENDCDINQESYLDTAFILAYGSANYGFDPTQQRRPVNLVILSETNDAEFEFHGLIVVGGVPYSLEVEDPVYSMPGYTP